jgi:hypothetical protein
MVRLSGKSVQLKSIGLAVIIGIITSGTTSISSKSLSVSDSAEVLAQTADGQIAEVKKLFEQGNNRFSNSQF